MVIIKVAIAYGNRGNAEKHIKGAKYSHGTPILLDNDAINRLMMLVYNLLLLFKMDIANGTEYRQLIKTFKLI